jgi:hypothetical protein
MGADGIFTFEGQHDVFLPLVVASGEADLDVMTNVAIAGPRSPLHLAHAAYDLQVYSRGRFRLGLGSQVKVHIEKRYGAQWTKPAERMAETVAAVKAIFSAWEGRTATSPGTRPIPPTWRISSLPCTTCGQLISCRSRFRQPNLNGSWNNAVVSLSCGRRCDLANRGDALGIAARVRVRHRTSGGLVL